MSDKFVLVVSDDKDGKHGEISVLDTAHETERLVETLVEAGFEQDRIRVFTGSQAEFVTVYRPVVNLINEANQTAARDLPVSHQAEPEVVEAGAEAMREPVEMLRGDGNARAESRLPSVFAKEGEEVRDEAALGSVEAGSGNGRGREGRRFSSTFRSSTDDKLDVYGGACEAAG